MLITRSDQVRPRKSQKPQQRQVKFNIYSLSLDQIAISSDQGRRKTGNNDYKEKIKDDNQERINFKIKKVSTESPKEYKEPP